MTPHGGGLPNDIKMTVNDDQDIRRSLARAFDRAWGRYYRSGRLTVGEDVARTALARRLVQLSKEGIRDEGRLAEAGLSHLRRLPVDFLKVDRSSLAASDDEDYRSWLLEAILIVGRDLSLTVIAKGIETFEQMTNLDAMGCTMAQGLFMGKPTPAESIASLFEVALPTPRAIDAPS